MPPDRVLLARPHDFIVDDMQKLMRDLGYEPVRLTAFGQLAQYAAAGEKFVGAVISTAASSMIRETFGQVFLEVRERFPRTPVAVATLSDLRAASLVVTTELGPKAAGYELLESDKPLDPPRLNGPRALLLLRKGDVHASRSPEVDRNLRAHFR